MKSTETSHYLAVALQSLEKILLPELSSPDAKATAEIMRQVLGELLKREHFTPRLLDEHIAEGELLAERMAALLTELGAKPETTAATALGQRAAGGDFPALARSYNQVTEHLAHLAEALCGQRGKIGDAAQQDYLSTLLHKAASWEVAFHSAQRAAATDIPPLQAKIVGTQLTQESLQTFLRTRHPAGDQCTVTAFAPIPGGFGKQTFRTTVTDGKGTTQNLIVRKSDPVPMIQHDGFFIDREFHLLKDIHAAGYPVAEPLYLGSKVPGVDADFYVMSALQGAVPSSFLGAATATIPESVLLNMAELLAQLHQLKLENFTTYLNTVGQTVVLTDTVESCYRRGIAEYRAYSHRVEHLPSPYITYLLDWLEQHVPHDTRRPVLVHGDFNIHNVLALDGRITGVLDWECSNFGAPEQDLAYIKPIISKHIGWDRFVGHYRASGGPQIDESTLNFYMAFSAMRVSVLFNRGVLNLQQMLTRDIRFAVVELGLTPEFMGLAMASTAAAEA